MKLKKGKMLRWFSTASIVIIAAILILPFFRPSFTNLQTATHQAAVIQLPPNPHVTKMVAEYEKEVKDLMRSTDTPGAAIAIVKDSSIVYIKGFGYKASNSKDSINEHTVFRIASVSKCFASFLTGVLTEQQLLSWNDPIKKYFPEFSLMSQEQADLITLTHVLSHTTGLPYHTYTNLVEEGLPLDELLAKLKDVKLSSAVGKEYSYQNVAYSLIEKAIVKTTGKSYEQVMQQQVFKPLGMNDASLNYKSLMANANIAKPHKLAKHKWVPAKITDTYYNVAPAGGINASIHDMANWMIALLGNRSAVIGEETLNEMFTPVIEARSKNRNYKKMQKFTGSYYGLGWRILHYPNDTIVYHGGYVNGYRSEVAVDPKDNIAICILANAPGQLADNGIPIFFQYFNRYRDEILAWERKQRIPQLVTE